MSVAHWSLHLIAFLAIFVFLNDLEISGHMLQYDKQGKPIHFPRRHNPQRRQRNNRPTSPPTTVTTEEPAEYEAEEGISTTSSSLYDYPTHRPGYGYSSYNAYDHQYTDPNSHGGGYYYSYGTTVEMEEQAVTTQTPRRAVKVQPSARTTVRKKPQSIMQSDQGGVSQQSSAESGNVGSKPGGPEQGYSGNPRQEGLQQTVSASKSASPEKEAHLNEAVSAKANSGQVTSAQVMDITQNNQKNTPSYKPPSSVTSGKRHIQGGNSKRTQQDRVIFPSRNAASRRVSPRQPTTPEPFDYDYMPLTMTKMCNCMAVCPYDTFYMGPCRGIVSWVYRQRRKTCCMRTEPLMRYLLPLAFLQNLLAEL
ncbi:hypothetical protein ACJMK2_007503 [Sinanodonta woodiana]|uniref:Uncharacterized protein n=1 Tax=Sinanodonta woodiana TaxID=1069815 RepID=A0ABD3VIR2_SINWO